MLKQRDTVHRLLWEIKVLEWLEIRVYVILEHKVIIIIDLEVSAAWGGEKVFLLYYCETPYYYAEFSHSSCTSHN